LTPLNFNAGYGKRNNLAPDALPAMVGGDVNQDGLIDPLDVQAIRDSASMSLSPRFSLRGYGVPANGYDRTIVDNNLGKVSSLRYLREISEDLGIY
jgi:hypothetical protein